MEPRLCCLRQAACASGSARQPLAAVPSEKTNHDRYRIW
jgi:hypothetical protein